MSFSLEKFENSQKEILEKVEEWNYLRNNYRVAHFTPISPKYSKIESLKSIFYGFLNWFKSYDYIIFSSSDARKYIDGKYYDTRSDFIGTILGIKKTLIIETPNPKHYSYKKTFTRNLVSRRFIDLITILIEKLPQHHYANSFLDELNSTYNFQINYSKLVRRFNVQCKIYKFWFKLIKPKYIFLNCFYDKQYIVKAAHDLSIEVIDLQHGIIGKAHAAYYSEIKLDKNYLPDYLFVFGKNDKNNLNKSKLFDATNIFSVGNYYLEILRKNFKKDKILSDTINKYTLSVSISLQWPVEKEMIEFIADTAVALPETLFILIPRKYEKKEYAVLNLPSNIIFFPSLDCYNIIMHCNYHCTAYSTCAIEAPSLGVPNILININDTTTKYMHNIFSKENTYIVNSKKEFINILERPYLFSKKKVIKGNEEFFVNNYKMNILKQLKHIGKVK